MTFLMWVLAIALGIALCEVIVPLFWISLIMLFSVAIVGVGIVFYPIAIFFGFVQQVWRKWTR